MNIAVIGSSNCDILTSEIAERTGRLIGENKWTLICGGAGGVMESACKGAQSVGGITVGLLPSNTQEEANRYLNVKIPMGIGYARNIFVVRAADVVIAIAGKTGTLSEIAFALNEGKTVYGLATWAIPGIKEINTPEKAIERIKQNVKQKTD